jgi:hypothetical protein
MRELIKHKAGRIYLGVLLLTIIGMLYIVRYFGQKILVFGLLPLPFFAGICFLIVWAIAYLVYFFRYWPYR